MLSRLIPSPVFWFQRILPVLRSRHMAWSDLFSVSTLEMKTRSPRMIGVDALGPGRLAVQVADSLVHSAGRPFSDVKPLKFGPRHCDQSAERTETAVSNEKTRVKRFMQNTPIAESGI